MSGPAPALEHAARGRRRLRRGLRRDVEPERAHRSRPAARTARPRDRARGPAPDAIAGNFHRFAAFPLRTQLRRARAARRRFAEQLARQCARAGTAGRRACPRSSAARSRRSGAGSMERAASHASRQPARRPHRAGRRPLSSCSQAAASRTSAHHCAQSASPKSPSLSPHPKRSNSSTSYPASASARACSAAILRALFISSANGMHVHDRADAGTAPADAARRSGVRAASAGRTPAGTTP